MAGFTEDLTRTIGRAKGPPLAPLGVLADYVRDNTTGSYELLAANFGFGPPPLFVAASANDSRILFEQNAQLLPAAIANGMLNLYEWDEGKPEGERLSLAGVLPNVECAALGKPSGCAPPNGSGAGNGADIGSEPAYQQNTISADGSKVFFTSYPSGHIYERESQAEPPVTVPVSTAAAAFLAATPSGRYVLYAEGQELFRFDTFSETRQALTGGAEGITGSLGVSDDGSYVYFVAGGVLAANQNANGEEATKGAANLYEWHEDVSAHTAAITFIAQGLEGTDWLANTGGDPKGEGKTSRLNPSGTALLFMSKMPLTGYDNSGVSEYFLYDADAPLSSANPVCVSCNPSGAAATAGSRLALGEVESVLRGPEWTPRLTRNLSVDGDRVFFETAESLLPGDTNGVSDVYEWEREGVGSCPAGSAHCLYLISTGSSPTKSFFGDASASGDDVFFFTRQPLVGQDTDLNLDVYDARVGGGIAAQNPPPVEPCDGEECKPPASPTPVFGAPKSSTLTGLGSIGIGSPYIVIKCAKGMKLSHGRCIKEKIKCAKGRKLSHGKCVKVKSKKNARGKKSKARKPTRPVDGGSK